mmetsp:Transcript_23508/g.65250  ORF Transcript_23508/g.65250 Transcript_23508/m.65250 type:complete len:177 (+) Transcript_23508:115-645(+)|eukprot:CAMPEP_0172371914 /NCGR_PEP_ID=MMETSP1060-20121228/45355_1 /TAXON_ID=37318 /ORGANISM="Pseudo-nitzschia pungens, Strain cf. cingulata" /LENGTH=176 /DNA_ID=CAMNT_0013097689 /DNA_START=96 /DNA_END=626 /DNA_ORIENTATION=+
MRGFFSGLKYSTVLCCFKAKNQTKISSLNFKILQLKKKFGIDYLTLVGDNASVEELKDCLKIALDEVANLQEEIDDLLNEIEGKEQKVNNKMTRASTPHKDKSPECHETNSEQPKMKPEPTKRRKSKDDVLNDETNDDNDFDNDLNSETREQTVKSREKSTVTSAGKKKKSKKKRK